MHDEYLKAAAGKTLAIYVPKPGFLAVHPETIAPKSAIVGGSFSVNEPDLVLVDAQGNLNDAVNLRTFEERLNSAAGRHVTKYPTIARFAMKHFDLIEVGSARYSNHLQSWYVASLTNGPALAAWLGEPAPRVGGSEETWKRAAGLLLNRMGPGKATQLAAKHGYGQKGLGQAMLYELGQLEPDLVPPIAW
jgi:hypothetical protein